MNSCLSSDLIVHRIICKLNLREKFGVRGIRRRWKNISIECLRHHEHLVISSNDPSSLLRHNNCDEHASLVTVNNNNLIWGKYTDLVFWQRTLSLLQAVKYVYFDVIVNDQHDMLFTSYKPILHLLIDTCGQSLECLCISHFRDLDNEIPFDQFASIFETYGTQSYKLTDNKKYFDYLSKP